MFSFDEFEDLLPFEKISEVLEAIYNDSALWPKRNGVTPKKYLHKPFTPYQYIPITPKNLPYMRRTF